jgi:hypothetical protein
LGLRLWTARRQERRLRDGIAFEHVMNLLLDRVALAALAIGG